MQDIDEFWKELVYDKNILKPILVQRKYSF